MFFGSIIFTQRESADLCLKTGECRINKSSVIKVRPYISQFAEKANKIQVKKRNPTKKQHQDEGLLLTLNRKASQNSSSTAQGTLSSSENLSISSMDRTDAKKFSSMENSSKGDSTNNSNAPPSPTISASNVRSGKALKAKHTPKKSNKRKKRKLRHPINFNQNSLSGKQSTPASQILKNIPEQYTSHNFLNLRLNQGVCPLRTPACSNLEFAQGVTSPIPPHYPTNPYSQANSEMGFHTVPDYRHSVDFQLPSAGVTKSPPGLTCITSCTPQFNFHKFDSQGSNFFNEQYWKKQEETFGGLNLSNLRLKSLTQVSASGKTSPAPQFIPNDKIFKIFC